MCKNIRNSRKSFSAFSIRISSAVIRSLVYTRTNCTSTYASMYTIFNIEQNIILTCYKQDYLFGVIIMYKWNIMIEIAYVTEQTTEPKLYL